MLKNNYVKWVYGSKVIDHIEDTPKGSFAFIYKITLEDNRYYIGKKFMWKPNYTSGINKGKSKGEYNWKKYTGSSKELNEIIKSGVKYKKEILMFTYSKAETTYKETSEILCSGALTDPNSLNYWVKSTIYAKHLKENT